MAGGGTMKRIQDRSVYLRPDGMWGNRRADSGSPSTVHDTQAEAINEARKNLGDQGGGELSIHGVDGRIIKKKAIKPKPNPVSYERIEVGDMIKDEITCSYNSLAGTLFYSIPFKLTRRPTDTWRNIFQQAWNNPPRFTPVHRPNIAKINDDIITLDGATMEEINKFLRETLLVCVNYANDKESEIIQRRSHTHAAL